MISSPNFPHGSKVNASNVSLRQTHVPCPDCRAGSVGIYGDRYVLRCDNHNCISHTNGKNVQLTDD